MILEKYSAWTTTKREKAMIRVKPFHQDTGRLCLFRGITLALGLIVVVSETLAVPKGPRH